MPNWFLCPNTLCRWGYMKPTNSKSPKSLDADPRKSCWLLRPNNAIWVAGGSIPIKTQDSAKVTNTALLFNPQGELVARYYKMHLFSYQDGTRNLDEGRTMVAGREVVTADAPWGRIGMSICYDLRFPELYRAMGNVDLILVQSAFTVPTGSAHWEVLLRARAIENQCYVLAAAQGGTHASGRQTYGHSILIDPWGEIVSVLLQDEGVVMGVLDLERLKSVRQNLQALRHRRLNTMATEMHVKHA